MIVAAGIDYADAIGVLLKQLGPGSPGWRYARQPTHLTTPDVLRYPPDTDWLQAARDLARDIGRRLTQSKSGVWLVVEEWDMAEEEHDLAHELAALMGRLDVELMVDSLTKPQWDDWKDWLRKRRLT